MKGRPRCRTGLLRLAVLLGAVQRGLGGLELESELGVVGAGVVLSDLVVDLCVIKSRLGVGYRELQLRCVQDDHGLPFLHPVTREVNDAQHDARDLGSDGALHIGSDRCGGIVGGGEGPDVNGNGEHRDGTEPASGLPLLSRGSRAHRWLPRTRLRGVGRCAATGGGIPPAATGQERPAAIGSPLRTKIASTSFSNPYSLS